MCRPDHSASRTGLSALRGPIGLQFARRCMDSSRWGERSCSTSHPVQPGSIPSRSHHGTRTSSAASGWRRRTASTDRPEPRHRQADLRGRPTRRRRTSSSRSTPPTPPRTRGARSPRPSGPRCSTRSPTRSTRTGRCSRSPRAGRTASRSARPSPPTSRWPPTTSATSPPRRAPRRAASTEIDKDLVAYHFREPLGVVGQIIPFNFPLLMAAWKLAPALAAGNCTVIKPASPTPWSILKLTEVIEDIVPPGVINIVNGPAREIGKALADQPADREDRLHRRDRDRPADHAVRRAEPHPGHPGARRQVAEHLLQRRDGRTTTTSSTRPSKAWCCTRSTRARSAPARRGR